MYDSPSRHHHQLPAAPCCSPCVSAPALPASGHTAAGHMAGAHLAGMRGGIDVMKDGSALGEASLLSQLKGTLAEDEDEGEG